MPKSKPKLSYEEFLKLIEAEKPSFAPVSREIPLKTSLTGGDEPYMKAPAGEAQPLAITSSDSKLPPIEDNNANDILTPPESSTKNTVPTKSPKPAMSPELPTSVSPASEPGTTPLKPEDIYGKGLSDEDRAKLYESLKEKGQNQAWGRAASQFGDVLGSMGGVKTNFGESANKIIEEGQKAPIEEMDKQRSAKIQTYLLKKQLIEDAKSADADKPNTPEALRTAKMMVHFELATPDEVKDASTNDLLKLSTLAEKGATIQNTKEMKKLALENAKQNKDLAVSQKQSQFDQRDLSMVTRQLNADKDMTSAREVIRNGNRFNQLYDQMKTQPGGPDKRQTMEAALSTLRVLVGSGQMNQTQLEHLIPETYHGRINSFLEKVTGDPMSAETQNFVDRFHDTIGREIKWGEDTVEKGFNRTVATHKDVLQRNPDVATELYSQWGVNHPAYNPKKEVPKPAESADEFKGFKVVR